MVTAIALIVIYRVIAVFLYMYMYHLSFCKYG